MADATIGAYAGMFQTIVGGLTSAFGEFQRGIDEQRMYDYQAGVARLNAQIAYQNATYATQVGEIRAQNAGLAEAQLMGRIKVAQAGSGLDVNSGSTAAVRASQRLVSGLDVATIRSEAAKTAYNYEVQGVQFGAQAQLDTLAGQNARTSGMIGAASSIVGAASSVSSEWLRGSQLGIWGGGTSSPSTAAALPNPTMTPSSQPLGGGALNYGGS